MFFHLYKKMADKICVLGIIALLSITITAFECVIADTMEHGVENVNKLKYADPVKDIHLYLCAFHIAKNNPNFEVEAHHYCSMRNLTIGKGEIHQCVIYDSKEAPAKLLGIEYIISNDTYQTLPESEKKILASSRI